MADLQQYPLPNPSLPFGQQAVSPVAQTNPLMSLGSGVNTGISLGLQAGQLSLQAKQQAMQQQLQQAQIQQAKAAILKEALGTAHADFDTLSKINPDMAIDYYHQKIAPLQDEFWGQYGIKMDSSQIPSSHNNADILGQANQLTDMVLNDPSKIAVARAGLSHLQNRMDVGEMAQQKLNKNVEAVNAIGENQKNQEKLAQDWVTANESLRGDSVYKGLETQRNSAAQGYDTLKKYQKQDGTFNLNNAQVVDLYGQLWKAQTGGVLSPGELNEMNQASLQKNYAKLAGIVGLSPNALPTQFGNRMLDMFTNLGNFTESQHASMETAKAAKPGDLNDPNLIAATQQRIGRGMTFPQMKAKSDSEYEAKSFPKFNSEADALKANLPKGTIVKINGKNARID